MLKGTILFIAVLFICLSGKGQQVPPYKNPALSIEERVQDLLSKMTLEEKFGQLFMIPFDPKAPMSSYKGSMFGFQFSTSSQNENDQMMNYEAGGSALEMALEINRVQQYFIDSTRLGIPIIAFDEALHGLIRADATSFPQAIGLAATWNTALIAEVAGAIADEVQARGIRQILSPVINIADDARWGRVEETYGEDPFLVTAIGCAYINAFEKRGIVTTPKHFIVNSANGGRDSYPVHFSERLMEEVYYRPFIAAIQKAGARSIMTAYNSYNGTPCTASPFLLQQKLRKDWGFSGFVISDAGATGGANVLHFTASDYTDATKKSIEAGLDIIFQTSIQHYDLFFDAFKKGLISDEAIDSAVARVLRVKFELGLFENPYADTVALKNSDYKTKHKDLAYQAACESVVLLKNENNTLPLNTSIESLAVIGIDATEGRLGGYSRNGRADVSILDGITQILGPEKVKYAAGCKRDSSRFEVVPADYFFHIEKGEETSGLKAEYFNNIRCNGKADLIRTDANIDFAWTLFSPDPEKINYDFFSARWTGFLKSPQTGTFEIGIRGDDGYRLWINDSLVIDNFIKKSVGIKTIPYYFEKGKNYSIRLEFFESAGNTRIQVISNIGVKDNSDEKIREAADIASACDAAVIVVGIEEGEFRDRAFLTLPGKQEKLINTVSETGVPVIVIIVGGGPIIMKNWIENADAIADIWYPGDQGGHAVADILFGNYNPSGKLPVSFPKDESQLPFVYYHKPTGRGDDYMNLSGKPEFPFGYGLSYTTFEYSNLVINKREISTTDSTFISFTLTNSGEYEGTEVVQLYIRDELASLARPVSALKAFQKIQLKSGESKDIRFSITPEMLMMLNNNMQWVVEPGIFRIMIGSSSNDIRLRGNIEVR